MFTEKVNAIERCLLHIEETDYATLWNEFSTIMQNGTKAFPISEIDRVLRSMPISTALSLIRYDCEWERAKTFVLATNYIKILPCGVLPLELRSRDLANYIAYNSISNYELREKVSASIYNDFVMMYLEKRGEEGVSVKENDVHNALADLENDLDLLHLPWSRCYTKLTEYISHREEK